MSDMLADGLTWLHGRRAAALSQTVTYCRGSLTDEIAATVGQTTYETEDSDGFLVSGHLVDFIISTSVFPYDEPNVGDLVLFSGLEHEVTPLPGEGHWRWSDPHHTALRVHTKEVGET